MKPILYPATEKEFKSKGLGELGEVLTASVHEMANSTYEASLSLPRNSRFLKLLRPGMFLRMKPNSVDNYDIFIINSVDITTNGEVININCGHYTDLTNNSNLVKKITMNGNRPLDVINLLPERLDNTYGFTFYTDDTRNYGNYDITYLNQNPNEIIIGDTSSLQKLTGDLVRKRLNKISLLRNPARQVVSIRRGKNIVGIDIKRSNDGLVTKMVPYYIPKDDEKAGIKDADPVYGFAVFSPNFNKYPQAYVQYVDYSSRADNSADVLDLSKKFFDENPGIDVPAYDVIIDVEEYGSKRIQQVQVGDIASIYDPDYDLTVELPIYETTYNPILEKMDQIRCGTQPSTLFHYLESRIKETQDKIEDTKDTIEKETDSKIDKAKDDTEEYALTAANGRNKNYYGDTEPKNPQEGDHWFKGALGTGPSDMWAYINGEWVQLFPEGRDSELKKMMEDADAETEAWIKAAGFDSAQELYKAVSDNGVNITSIKANANGLQTQITNNANNTSSRFTQMSNLFDSKITDTANNLSSQITQKVNSIKLSTTGGYLYLNGSSVYMGGSNIYITGQTYIADAAIKNASIANVDAGKIVTGTLSAIKIRGVDIQASTITGSSEITLDAGPYTTKISATYGLSTSGFQVVPGGWMWNHGQLDSDGVINAGGRGLVADKIMYKGAELHEYIWTQIRNSK
jgi:phage minor structural protein